MKSRLVINPDKNVFLNLSNTSILIFEFYIAQRMRFGSKHENTVSTRIIKIAILAVVLGMIVMLIAMGTSFGLQREIKSKTVALTGDIRITPFENNSSSISVTPIYSSEALPILESVLEDTDRIVPYISAGALLRTKNEFEGAVLKGLPQAFSWDHFETYKKKGKFPVYEDELSKAIVISATMARKLGLAVGDRITAYFQQNQSNRIPRKRYFKITAIYQTGFPDYDNTIAFVDMRQLQQINQWEEGQIGGYDIFLSQKKVSTPIASEIYQKLPPHIDVQTAEQLHAGLYDWISLFDFNLVIILIVMILVGTLNMATALLVLILERSRMIGRLKTMGADRRQIQNIFLVNAAYIVAKGLLWGNLLGLGILYSQHQLKWFKLNPEDYFVSTLPVYIDFWMVLGLNVLVFLFCVGFLWLPTVIIQRIDPTQVLRFR